MSKNYYKNRRNAVSLTQYRYKYSELYNIEGLSDNCIYCGEYADTKDHVIPVLFMKLLIEAGDTETRSTIVPCCLECNCIASSRVFSSLYEKFKYIRSGLRLKYEKMTGVWSHEELKSMGRSIRKNYELDTYILKKSRLKERINHEPPESFLMDEVHNTSRDSIFGKVFYEESREEFLSLENKIKKIKLKTDSEKMLNNMKEPIIGWANATKVINMTSHKIKKVINKEGLALPAKLYDGRVVFEKDTLMLIEEIVEEEEDWHVFKSL